MSLTHARPAVGDALDVRSDPERVIGRAEHSGRAHHGPWKVARAREHRLAPAHAVGVVERLRWLTFQRNEVLLARGLAVEVGINGAGRDENVALAAEVLCHRRHLIGPVAREVEQHVRPYAIQRAAQLVFIGAVEGDVAREGAIGSFLASCRDGLDPAPHQLLACGGTDKSGPADY